MRLRCARRRLTESRLGTRESCATRSLWFSLSVEESAFHETICQVGRGRLTVVFPALQDHVTRPGPELEDTANRFNLLNGIDQRLDEAKVLGDTEVEPRGIDVAVVPID